MCGCPPALHAPDAAAMAEIRASLNGEITMKWISAKKEKPLHDDLVLAAMWRPDQGDYTYRVAAWNGSDLV